MNRFFLLLLSLMIAAPCWATGNGPPVGAYKQALEGFPTDAGFVLMSGPRSDLPNARGAIVGGTNIAVTDGGAGGNITVAVSGQIAIANGGTGASTREAALDALMSFAGLTSQDLAYYDGTHWVRLAKGANNTYLTTNGSGNLAWSASTSGGIADSAQVLLMTADASAVNGRVATQGSGITITDGTTIATFAVDNTVIRTTGSQSMADKTLTNPSMAWNAGGGIALQASTFNSALKWADWAAARNLTIPDPGADANFVLSEGNATVNGEKTFSDLKLSGTTFKTAANTITVPAATDTLVNLSSTQVLTNKELTAPLVSGTIGYKAGSFQHNIAAAAPSADRAVTLPDPGTDSKFALTSTTITHANGGVIYSNGATMACSAAGTSGKALISAGAAAPSFGTLGADGGGTGQTTYTKGDLLATPGGTTLNKLGVGTDGQVLTADTASTNGIKWATPTSAALTLNGLGIMTSGAGSLTAAGTTGDLPYFSASNTFSKLAIGSTGKVLQVSGGVPVWNTFVDPAWNGFRISLSSTDPEPSSDITGASTLYWLPYKGNRISLYDGSDWQSYAASSANIAIPADPFRLFAVYIYNNSGTPTLELDPWDASRVSSTITAATVANPCVITLTSATGFSVGDKIGIVGGTATGTGWTDTKMGLDGKEFYVSAIAGNQLTLEGCISTGLAFTTYGTATAYRIPATPATDVVRQNGVLSKTGALTRRYVGLIATNGAGTVDDALKSRCCSNVDNAAECYLEAEDVTASYTTPATSVLEPSRGALTLGINRFIFALAVPRLVFATARDSGPSGFVGVGIDINRVERIASASSGSSTFKEVSYGGSANSNARCEERRFLGKGKYFFQQMAVGTGYANAGKNDTSYYFACIMRGTVER